MSLPLWGAFRFFAIKTKTDIQLCKEIWRDDPTRDPEENCWHLSVLWFTKNEATKIRLLYRTRVCLRHEQKLIPHYDRQLGAKKAHGSKDVYSRLCNPP